ncbi:hypothetical protein KY290_036819 [Solanum tuberosum]|uniref:Uncharacterized protein n=1 Tax=Solanum tuberosum TaxID=4113 RepID=A0ABQ7TTS9_SOLTU|nr:hypothetical protein KY289_036294 [Solanum tuberosum]KAH0639552.1 hypothetical protein KY285_036138 [Solanum tuberosum]KAH0738114.1 hypothetical protein KY290_036819 [Solanum tuberosum]
MPKFKRLQKKQNSDQLVSDSQGAKSTNSFLQSTSCLPPHQTTSFLATTHSVPLFQPTLKAPPIFQLVSQSSQSVHSASHSATMDQLMSQLAPTAYPTSQPSHLVHSTSHPALTEQDSSQQVPTVQAPFKKRIGRESQSYWTVETIDSENNVKRLRSKFSFKTTKSNVRQHIYKSIGKKWDANKNNLWKLVKDPLKSKVKIIDNVPDGIPRDQWISFVDYQYKDSTKEMRRRNTENRKKQTIPHTGGSKVNATRRAKMMAEIRQRPGRAQIYIATHKNKDGVYVNEAAKEIFEKIELTLSQSTMDEFQISPNDVVGKVLGKEHSGRAYMIMKEGMIPKQVAGFFASPSTNSPTTTPSDAASEPIPPMHTRRSCSGDSNPSHDNR